MKRTENENNIEKQKNDNKELENNGTENEKAVEGNDTECEKKQEYKSRIFTQEEVNELIQRRLVRDREKYEREYQALMEEEEMRRGFSQREALLREREQLLKAREILIEKGYPIEIKDILNYASKEADMEAQIEKVMKILTDLAKNEVDERLKTVTAPKISYSSKDEKNEMLRSIMLGGQGDIKWR